MANLIKGIHHITALADDPQRNLDFYSGVLGIRLVKKTVNFDAPEIYHLYYGDAMGRVGSTLTFFPYRGIVKGRRGKGMLNTMSFSVPTKSMDYWKNRFKRIGIRYIQQPSRFDDEVAWYFEDDDGTGLELIFNEKDTRPGASLMHIPEEYAIKGFYRVEIWLDKIKHTADLLQELLEHRLLHGNGNFYRLAAVDSPGNYVDLLEVPNSPRALGGGGTVHHLAFSTPDGDTQLQVREKIEKAGFNPTPVVDRQYFNSIYFREPGGVLFEVATNGPGFLIDEDIENLGTHLKLPPWYESRRSVIDKSLGPIYLNMENFK